MLDVGMVLGLEDKAAKIIADYDERLTELKSKVSEADFSDKPVATIVWQGRGSFFVPVDRPSNMILRSLDIPQPSFQSDPSAGEVSFSFENVALLNEAYAVIVLLEGAGTQENMEASPVWQLIDRVKNGRVVFLDADLWDWDYMPALMSMLGDVEQKLLPLAASPADE